MLGAPIAAVHGTVQLQDQSELQVMGNTTSGGVGGSSATWSFSTTPAADISAAWGRWTLGLRYAVVVTGRTLESNPSVDVLQQGTFNLLWRTRRFHLAINELASYGTSSYATAAITTPGGTTPVLQALPLNATMRTGGSRSTLTLTGTLSRRFEGSVYGGLALTGGLDDASRDIQPLQLGPIGGGRLSYLLSRNTWLDARAEFVRTDFYSAPCTSAPTTVGLDPSTKRCFPRDDQLTITLGMRRSFSRTTDLAVQAGVAEAGIQPDIGKPYKPYAYPAAGVTLTYRSRDLNTETNFRLITQLLPMVSPQTGGVDERLLGDASFDWTSARLVLRGQARASQSVPFDVAGAYVAMSLDTSIGVRFDRYVTLSFGQRTDVQWFAAGQTLTAVLGYLRFQLASRTYQF